MYVIVPAVFIVQGHIYFISFTYYLFYSCDNIILFTQLMIKKALPAYPKSMTKNV
jgi:hypothetical protein